MPLLESPLFSVIVPAYQAEETLEACLEALTRDLNGTPEITAEIIVVDDGSHDQTAAIAARLPCKLIRLPQNRGAAAARNAGIREARGRFVWLLDADGVVKPGTLSKIHQILMNEEARADAVFGMFASEHIHRNFSSQYKLHLMRSYFLRIPANPRAICTAICAVRKEALTSIGGFDERITGATVEDQELGERLVSHGFRIAFDPSLEVVHLKHYSGARLVVTQFERAYGMGKLFFSKSGIRETGRTGFFFLVPLSFGLSLVLGPLTLMALGATWYFGYPALALACLVYGKMAWDHQSFLRVMFKENGALQAIGSIIVLPFDFTFGAFSAWLGWLAALGSALNPKPRG